jgi:hypothetical protein
MARIGGYIPIPKVLDFFSKRGFWGVLATFLVPSGYQYTNIC